ncbi:MAG: PQQ-binding-like beta-propeller repeat protein [Anaerolineales bacterium]|nr:PQQ-binding-like beta-propeller repeat protein [Anaerolineales bacterium]MCS7248001.1 PQQ-binding-like beta-propeller repeat protein [Anaerolineales bacterium]MDW8161813.1 PQQ-binding-like beta-propeller repeat protein [Anaerolineales bacterium]MDW8446492.1 PQQ-binding-like beta-propeller repeat protein [Anaerolineales bacterium]
MDTLRYSYLLNFVQSFLPWNWRKKSLAGLLLKTALFFSALALTACGPGSMMSNWPGASVENGVVFVAYQAHVYALRAENGAELWRFPPEADNRIAFYAPPALSPDGTQLIVGGFNHVLYSLNPQNGTEQWKFEESKYPYIAKALITEETIYAPTNGNLLYALDRQGRKRWEFETKAPTWAAPVYDVNCDCVYIASLDHVIYAVRAKDGVELWQTKRLEGAIASTPVLGENGVLYFGTFGNLFHAFDTRSQVDLWTYQTSHWVWGSPLLLETQVILTDLSGAIIALEAKSGRELWKFVTDAAITAAPALIEGVIYVGNENGNLYALDLQGTPIWQQPKKFDGKILSAVLSAERTILVPLVAEERVVVALNSDGGETWSFQPAK